MISDPKMIPKIPNKNQGTQWEAWSPAGGPRAPPTAPPSAALGGMLAAGHPWRPWQGKVEGVWQSQDVFVDFFLRMFGHEMIWSRVYIIVSSRQFCGSVGADMPRLEISATKDCGSSPENGRFARKLGTPGMPWSRYHDRDWPIDQYSAGWL